MGEASWSSMVAVKLIGRLPSTSIKKISSLPSRLETKAICWLTAGRADKAAVGDGSGMTVAVGGKGVIVAVEDGDGMAVGGSGVKVAVEVGEGVDVASDWPAIS